MNWHSSSTRLLFHPFLTLFALIYLPRVFPPSQVHSPEGQILWTAPFNTGHAAPVPAKYKFTHCYMTLLDDGSLTMYGTNNKKQTRNLPVIWTSDTCKV